MAVYQMEDKPWTNDGPVYCAYIRHQGPLSSTRMDKYRKTSSKSRTKSQNLNVFCIF